MTTKDSKETTDETVLVSGLTDKQDRFCVALTDVESDTYGNGTEAARKAGYATESAHNAAWKLRRRPKVQARLNELYDEIAGRRSLTPSRVLSDIEDVRRRAIKKGDLATAARCSELMGKTLAIFRDCTQFVAPEEQRQLDEREAEECRQIALIRLQMQIEGQAIEQENGQDGEGVSPPNQERRL